MTINQFLSGVALAAPAFFTRSRVTLVALTLLQTTVLSAASVWTTAASACTVDNDIAISEVAAAELKLRPGSTGAIVARCNITNPLDSGADPQWNRMRVTYRDPDGTGTVARVNVKLRRVNLLDGATTTITEFNSDQFTGVSAQYRQISFVQQFQFLTYAYYLELRVGRTSTFLDPVLYRVDLRQNSFPLPPPGSTPQ